MTRKMLKLIVHAKWYMRLMAIMYPFLLFPAGGLVYLSWHETCQLQGLEPIMSWLVFGKLAGTTLAFSLLASAAVVPFIFGAAGALCQQQGRAIASHLALAGTDPVFATEKAAITQLGDGGF
jgi:hypothetical protein